MLDYYRDTLNAAANVGRTLLMINRFIVSSGIRIMTRATLDHQHNFVLSNSSYTSVLKGIDKFKVFSTANNKDFCLTF